MAKIFIVAGVLDLIYQITAIRWFHPSEALIVAAILAFLHYTFVRGLVNLIVRSWHGRAC